MFGRFGGNNKFHDIPHKTTVFAEFHMMFFIWCFYVSPRVSRDDTLPATTATIDVSGQNLDYLHVERKRTNKRTASLHKEQHQTVDPGNQESTILAALQLRNNRRQIKNITIFAILDTRDH